MWGVFLSKVLGAQVSYYVTPKNFKALPCSEEEKRMVCGTVTCDNRVFAISDIILAIGQHVSTGIKRQLAQMNIPIIIIRLGNDFCYDLHRIIHYSYDSTKDSTNKNDSKGNNIVASIIQGQEYTDTWISPHFAYTTAYYDYLSRKPLNSTQVVPYFWSPMFFAKILKKANPLMPCNKGNIRVAVFESNQTIQKSMFYPLMICHYADEYIKKAFFMCCRRLVHPNSRYHSSFTRFCNLAKGLKSGKLTFEDRIPMLKVMKGHANVILSWQRDWGLNFIYLEAIFANIPLIHNSREMKEFGFYFEENDVQGAVDHLKNLHDNGFDSVAYRKKNIKAITQFGMYQPALREFVMKRFQTILKQPLERVEEKPGVFKCLTRMPVRQLVQQSSISQVSTASLSTGSTDPIATSMDDAASMFM